MFPKKWSTNYYSIPELLHLGGEERVVSVLFSDIENFTTLSERLSPRELVSLLNTYLTEMTAIVLEQGGIIDKYIGDGIMAEYGAPIPDTPACRSGGTYRVAYATPPSRNCAPNGANKACQSCVVVWALIPGPWSWATSVLSRSSTTP